MLKDNELAGDMSHIRSKKLTLNEHRAVGRRTQGAYNLLSTQYVQIAKIFGKRSSAAKKMKKSVEIFLAARCDLEDISYSDHPEYQGRSLYLGVTAEN